jgi:hypothetical protein
MEANPQRWLFGHEHDEFAAAGPRPGVPPVFWPPLFAAADAQPDAGGAAWRDGGHCSAELVAAHAGAQWGGAQGGGGGGGRFVNGGGSGRNGAYASPLSHSEDGDGDRSDAGRDAGPSCEALLAPHAGGSRRSEENGHRSGRGSALALSGGSGGDVSGTIPEIASDAALAELQARIREDCMALRQVRRGRGRGRAARTPPKAPPALSFLSGSAHAPTRTPRASRARVLTPAPRRARSSWRRRTSSGHTWARCAPSCKTCRLRCRRCPKSARSSARRLRTRSGASATRAACAPRCARGCTTRRSAWTARGTAREAR